MKHTPFTEVHKSLGARMHEFAGYLMPIEYAGIINEHMAVCNAVGVFDVSHMGEFWVKGPHALPFLQKITVNDVSVLSVGKAQYTCFVNENGGIIDDLLLYRIEEEKYMLVVNASNIEKDWNWCKSQNTEDAVLENASNHTALLSVQGPKALDVLQKLTDADLSAIPYYSAQVMDIAGVSKVIVSNTGYTGAGGFELYFFPSFGLQIWNAIFEAGKEYGIVPVGLGARDTLRLEMGFCLYGNELNDTTTPLEAGLGWITKFVENKDFIGRPSLEKQKQEGVSKKLCGFVFQERGVPRQGYQVVNQSGEVIGEVTSGSVFLTTKVGFGLAYVESKHAVADNIIYIRIRNKDIPARIVKPPFRNKK